MKLAGRKNDGAWYRTNLLIQGNEARGVEPLTTEEKASLNAAIYAATEETRDNAFMAIGALAAEVGVDIPGGAPTTAAAWISRLVERGIPRQIWYGHLSFTTYAMVEHEGVEPYLGANYQSEFLQFAKQLRKACIKWIMGRRQVRDLMNFGGPHAGNPGGHPDANRPDLLED